MHWSRTCGVTSTGSRKLTPPRSKKRHQCTHTQAGTDDRSTKQKHFRATKSEREGYTSKKKKKPTPSGAPNDAAAHSLQGRASSAAESPRKMHSGNTAEAIKRETGVTPTPRKNKRRGTGPGRRRGARAAVAPRRTSTSQADCRGTLRRDQRRGQQMLRSPETKQPAPQNDAERPPLSLPIAEKKGTTAPPKESSSRSKHLSAVQREHSPNPRISTSRARLP